MSEPVLTQAHGRVLVVTINRPEARNAIANNMADGLVDAITQLDDDEAFSVGVLTGAGPGFCAGMDLKAFATEGFPRQLHTVYQRGTAKPLVAAIEGFALAGGLELALICDLLVASRDTRLGIPEATRGLFAAGGGVIRLARRLPYGVAMEMALTGDPISAQQAHAYGLVNRLTDPGKALQEAIALAERVARNAPLSVRASKLLVRDTLHMPETEFWEHQKPLLRQVMRSKDAREGARAFAEKREPRWTGT